MAKEVELNQVPDVLENLTYPISRTATASAIDGVILVLPDRKMPLGQALSEIPSDSFSSADELELALFRVLATETAKKVRQLEEEN